MATGIAVDPTTSYVAVAFQGVFGDQGFGNGNIKLFSATNGALLAELDLGVEVNGDPTHQDTDAAWDAVGNLYYIDSWIGHWRVFSPPGTNQATTLAVSTVQVPVQPPPVITNITVSSGTVTIIFTALTTDLPSAFAVMGSSNVLGPYAVLNATISSLTPGVFKATLPANGSIQFYNVIRKSSLTPQAPIITGIRLSGGMVTINFTGSSNDSFTAFKVVSATTVPGPYSNAPGASVSLVSAGVFRATVPVNGPVQFYRILR
jgi:hypothetical protein